MKFVMNRNRVVETTKGHVIGFKKGEPTFVPYACYDEVQAAGAVPEEEIPEDPVKVAADPQGGDRDALIAAAIEEIVLKNAREDFTAGGAPHAKVISHKVGFTVDAHERDDAWTKFNTAKD